MKRALLLVLLVLLCETKTLARPLGEQRPYIQWALYRYPVHAPLLIATLRYEDGRVGSEAGLNPVKTFTYGSLMQDPQAYADPTMPDGALQHSRLARRIIMQTQEFVLDDQWRRNEFFKDLAKKMSYDLDVLKKVYGEERERWQTEMKKGLFDTWIDEAVPPTKPLDVQRALIRWTVYRFRVRQDLFSTISRLDGGHSGLDAIKSAFGGQDQDPPGMIDLIPEGALIHCRIAWRSCSQIQDWIFEDEWRRRQFLKWWSKKYLGGGRVAKNDAERDVANLGYAKLLEKLYNRERAEQGK